MTTTRHRVLDVLSTIGEYVSTFAVVLLVTLPALVTVALPAHVPTAPLTWPDAVTYNAPVQDDSIPGLSPHQITRQLAPEGWVPPTGKEIELWPDGVDKSTTRMVPVPHTAYVVPETSPDGGRVLPYEQWLDNSPVYNNGWVLWVNDSDGSITWRPLAAFDV